MESQRWDAIVVGAGPAGSAAAARMLQQQPAARVLILDKADFPRDKVCGDGIAAEAMDALSALDFDTTAVTEGFGTMRTLRLRSPGGVDVERDMQRDVHVIPRQVLDDRLVRDVVARGARLQRRAVRTVEVRDDEVVVDGELRASVVIGADGAESVVRRSLGHAPNTSDTVALAIRGYVPEPPGQDGTQVILMTEGSWPAYAWSFPISDGRANVGYGELLAHGAVSRRHMAQRLREMLPGAEVDEPQLKAHRLPLTTGRPAIGSGRVLLAGDAQSLINPMTGEGIYYAVLSGGLAGRAAASGAGAGAVYRMLLADRLGRHFRHTARLARLSAWTPLIDAGARTAHSDRRAFDDLVAIGLADGTVTPRLIRGLLRRLRWRA